MAGRRPGDHEAKKDRLRRSAVSLLMDDRSPAVSIPSICRDAGLNSQAVQYYFGNRDGLLWDIVHGHLRRLLQRVENGAPEDYGPIDRLYAMAHAYAGVIRQATPEHLMALSHARHLPRARHGDARMMQRWMLRTAGMMLHAAAPHAPAERVTPLALSLLALLNTQAVWFRDGAGMSRGEYVDMAVQMVLSAARGGGPVASRVVEPTHGACHVRANEGNCHGA